MKRILLLCLMVCSLGMILAQTNVLPWGEEKTFRQADDFTWNNATAALGNNVVYVWTEVNGSRNNIYAQMRDINGNTLWGAQPVVINQDNLSKERPQIIKTSDNCLVISWLAFELCSSVPTLYFQKINAEGQLVWLTQGMNVTGEEFLGCSLKMVADSNGGFFYALYTGNSYAAKDLRAQHLNAAGNTEWNPEGVLIISTSSLADNFGICRNNQNGIFIVYQTGSDPENQILVSSINSYASFVFQDHLVSNAVSLKSYLQIARDNQGGLVACWYDNRGDLGIYTQRINQNGQQVWSADTISQLVVNEMQGLSINIDAQNNSYIVTSTYNSTSSAYLHQCSKVDSSGVVDFTDLSIFSSPYTFKTASSIMTDNCLYVACGFNTTESQIVIQKINSSGEKVFGADGIVLLPLPNNGNNRVDLVNTANGLVFMWTQILDEKSTLRFKTCNFEGVSQSPAFSVKSSSNLWSNDILAVIGYPDQSFPIWKEEVYDVYQKWFTRKVDALGNMSNEILIDQPTANYYTPRVTPNSSGGFTIFGLFSSTDPFEKLYAKYYNSQGINLWGNPGKLITSNANYMISTLAVNNNEEYSIFYATFDMVDATSTLRVQKIVNGNLVMSTMGHVVIDNIDGNTRLLDFKNNILFVKVNRDDGLFDFKAYKLTETMDLDPSCPAEGYELFPGNFDDTPVFCQTEQGTVFANSSYYNSQNNIVVQIIDNNGNLVFQPGGYHLNIDNGMWFKINWNNGLEVYYQDNLDIKVCKFEVTGNQVTPLWNNQSYPVFSIETNDLRTLKIRNYGNYSMLFIDSVSDPNLPWFRNLLLFNTIDQSGNVYAGNTGLEISPNNEVLQSIFLLPSDDNTVWLAWSDMHYETHMDNIFFNLKIQKLNIQALGTDNPINEPTTFKLNNNYPNPFNPETTISFNLPEQAKVELSVYNIKGQKVTNLVNETRPAGKHSVAWKGMDSTNKPVSSGVYFYKMTANGKSQIKKMLLVK